MGICNQDAIKQLQSLMENVNEQQKITFQNMHQGYPTETLARFLKARDWNVAKAHKMIIDCLQWRVENEIDNVLSKPIPVDVYKAVRDSQLIGMSGYSKEGLPVIAVGVGLSTFDKASDKYYVQSHIQMNEYRDRVVLPTASKKQGRYIGTCVKVLDMTGLKISALNQLRLLTAISTIDDLNYPEKTDTYYIVNVPYVFSACWKVVKPLLQERTRKKVQVLQGCGKEELLKVMDYQSLPHFCRKEGSGSSKHRVAGDTENCFSFDSSFHQQLYNFIKQQAVVMQTISPIRQGSFYVDLPEPDPDDAKIAKTIESELHKLEIQNGSMNGVAVNGH
ncbi:SEC14 cytosolic factor isoform X1 [Arachis stenosperma]|uniref:SEC14 cytosolic factor isoform X1 n=1 Tax=Arachis stenosperma TaxID=217475 RepID=UPI0025AC6BCD|nr:SEC14 cytosolic factor isoform X1 [Arachis stenosperma]